jgi:hypothetical protein
LGERNRIYGCGLFEASAERMGEIPLDKRTDDAPTVTHRERWQS